MSWSWRGFFRDDPVFRFKENGFFQSGRHAAEERFWKLKIHEDGSFVHRNASSLDNFYTMKDALRREEKDMGEDERRRAEEMLRVREEEIKRMEAEELKRREGSVEEKSQVSTQSDSSSDSSSSSSDSSSDEDDMSPEQIARRKKKTDKKKKRKAAKKERKMKDGKRRMEEEREREIERRERELEIREREIDRQSRSREQTPEYSYNPYLHYRSRRNSEISNKDYPYSVSSEYVPATSTIKEEDMHKDVKGRKEYYQYENNSSRYF